MTKKLASFSTIGIALTILGAIIIWVLVGIGVNANIANVIQAVISIESNFLLNNITTWKDRRDHSFLQRILRYHAVKFLVTIPLNQVVFTITYTVSGSWALAYIVSTGFIMIVNYVLNDYYVFGSTKTG